jgi:hypothetical protein
VTNEEHSQIQNNFSGWYISTVLETWNSTQYNKSIYKMQQISDYCHLGCEAV